MTLDLTKPMRVKQTHPIHTWRGKRFYPANMEGVAHFESAGIIKGDEHWRIVDLNYLENIPAIIRLERWVNVYDKEHAVVGHCTKEIDGDGVHRLGNAVHLIFCHDPETGKTWAEVPEEESCK